ncbi:uncharacterized protein TNCV_3837951 [Trichonephila clavipes]|nr:uncharacterized protein TNCV_3837951 [Trichonephila clavipes]
MLAKNFKKYFLNEDNLVASYEWIRDLFQDTLSTEGLSTSEEEIFIDFTSSEKLKGSSRPPGGTPHTLRKTALRCFKCQRFGHSQIACCGQLTCSRCAFVGHSSADCRLAQKCVNCSQPHSSDSKLCSKWKAEKEIQAIKTKRNMSYAEARKLVATQLSQTYAQVAKSSTVTSTTQTDENITKIVCPPLKLLKPLISVPKPSISYSVPAVTKSSTSTQALPSISSVRKLHRPLNLNHLFLLQVVLPPHLIVYLPRLHLPHPQYQCLHPYQHVQLFKLLSLHPIT